MKHTPVIYPITIFPQASLADPAHVILWSTKTSGLTNFRQEGALRSSGTRLQRILVALLAKSVVRSLKKNNVNFL